MGPPHDATLRSITDESIRKCLGPFGDVVTKWRDVKVSAEFVTSQASIEIQLTLWLELAYIVIPSESAELGDWCPVWAVGEWRAPYI